MGGKRCVTFADNQLNDLDSCFATIAEHLGARNKNIQNRLEEIIDHVKTIRF